MTYQILLSNSSQNMTHFPLQYTFAIKRGCDSMQDYLVYGYERDLVQHFVQKNHNKLPDGEYTITIDKKRKQRSYKQLAYHFAVVIATIVGWNIERCDVILSDKEAHEIFKVGAGWGEWVDKPVNTPMGKTVKTVYIGRSFSNFGDVSPDEYIQAVDKWRLFLADFGVSLPAPNEEEEAAMWEHYLRVNKKF